MTEHSQSEEEIAIKVSNVSKNFVLPHERISSVKGHFTKVFKSKNRTIETQKALQDISFEVKKGEFFGIVGRNGSGKSTLLKILAGIYQPTKGSVHVKGKLVPFIELGVGFNPELTGRENVYLNGALLGFSTKEMDEQYDKIVEFAELERFMDQKLKNYSSGMQVRLAFSVAIIADADILLIDEVLAVGDSNFQRKCYDYFKSLKANKKTVVFVSHDMQAVEEYCDRALFIKDSSIKYIGKTFEVAKRYNIENLELHDATWIKADDGESREPMKIVGAEVLDEKGKENGKFLASDKQIGLRLKLHSSIDIESPVVGVVINDSQKSPISAFSTKDIGINLPDMKAGDTVSLKLKIQNIFNDDNFYIHTNIKSNDRKTVYNMQDNIAEFGVTGRSNSYGIAHPEISGSAKIV